ncbi:MAG TPA: peptidylprolyl isomerase, partial [Terriglobales bacterium]|nr:peptidylprolyl isomerase [Terriglobales bacterium]
MKRSFWLLCMIGALSLTAWTQAKPATTTPPHRAGTPADAPDPIAIIDTTVGKMTCTLFPKKAPIGVDNFIGLSTGTKEWTDPTTHNKKKGVPLYDGTIFHRVIPEFMIQGGDPTGTGRGDPGYRFQNETSPDLQFDR